MSLTDDMIRLKLIADDIALNQKREINAPDSIVKKLDNSYYETRTKASNECESILKEYGFETPIELKNLLENMWKEMGKEEMLSFISVSMVASAKNKPQDGTRRVEHEVSPFIYEF